MKRLSAAGALVCLAAMLGACSPFAGYMADHWPHWAGGLPPDAPPRPGAPGYDDFISHGEPPAQNAPAPASSGPTNTTGTVAAPDAAQASTSQAKASAAKARNDNVQVGRMQSAPASPREEPASAAPAEPVETPTADDPSVVKGGLY